MLKIGRNEPCPCGSGEKYKNCCMKKNENINKSEESMMDRLFHKLLDFSERYYQEEFDYAFEMFWQDQDPDEFLKGRMEKVGMLNFFDWFVHDWTIAKKNDKNIITLFTEKEKKLSVQNLNVLNRMKESVISLFEVAKVNHGKEIVLEDLLLGGDFHFHEETVSQLIKRGDLLSTRVIQLDGKHVLGYCVYVYPSILKNVIIEDILDYMGCHNINLPNKKLKEDLKNNSEIFNYMWCDFFEDDSPLSKRHFNPDTVVISTAYLDITNKPLVLSGLKKDEHFLQDSKDEFMFFDNHDTEKERDSATGYIRIQDNTLILETYSITDLENGKRILADHFPAGLIHREDIYRNSHEFLELLEKSKDKKD